MIFFSLLTPILLTSSYSFEINSFWGDFLVAKEEKIYQMSSLISIYIVIYQKKNMGQGIQNVMQIASINITKTF